MFKKVGKRRYRMNEKIFILCSDCGFSIPLDKEESIYEKYIFCWSCDENFINPNFIGEVELNRYLKEKHDSNR